MSGLLALPIALWEFSLGVYLVVKGFRAAGLQQLGFEPVEPDEPAPRRPQERAATGGVTGIGAGGARAHDVSAA